MLIALSAAFDFYIGDTLTRTPPVPLEVAAIFFALNFLAISSIVYFLLSYAVRQRDRAQMKLANAHLQLQQEQTRSEGLLLNVLPAPVAARLKQDGGTFADRHAQVSVMFADLVEFTRTARGMTPVEIFAMLNEVFSSFDDLADRHRLEKIKTIGDAYMVAGGLLERDSSQSAEIAGMALEMHELLRKGSFGSGRDLSLRIGIATGPVVAGVVGRRKFIYDLWGDTANLASRITAEAQPGCILVDSETRRLLHVGFSFGAAQDLVLKGIGGFSAFELTGRRR
jgi:class 3 adenylate cyclase